MSTREVPKTPFLTKMRMGFGFLKRRIEGKFRQPLDMPKSYIPGMIPTLNDTGFMTETMDEFSVAFAEYAGTCQHPVLDIGCAYGVASIPALANGATVVACDMDQGHVDILAHRTPDADKARLTTDTGILPDKDYPAESFDAILAARVLHFLTPEQIQESVAKMVTWLKPGGKVFLITDTVYTGFWKQHATIYEEKKAAGDPWPGVIEKANEYLPEPARSKTSMTYMHLLDPDIFRRVAEEAGLIVEKVGYVRPSAEETGKAYGETDKERVGVIARKPE